MSTNRKFMLALATMALAAPGAMAAQVQTIDGYGPWQTNQGGEFTLQVLSGGPVTNLTYYNTLAKNQWSTGQPNFQTFCVEGTEYIYPNAPYDVTITSSTIFGGKALTAGAAWLYSQFAGSATGLAGYDYANTAGGRHASADALQRAIWAFMGQENQTLANNSGNIFLNAALTALGGSTNAFLANSAYGNYNVAVLNLWNPGQVGNDAGKRQDQLIMTGPSGNNDVPDGGFTVALLGISLTGLATLRRRFRPVS